MDKLSFWEKWYQVHSGTTRDQSQQVTSICNVHNIDNPSTIKSILFYSDYYSERDTRFSLSITPVKRSISFTAPSLIRKKVSVGGIYKNISLMISKSIQSTSLPPASTLPLKYQRDSLKCETFKNNRIFPKNIQQKLTIKFYYPTYTPHLKNQENQNFPKITFCSCNPS